MPELVLEYPYEDAKRVVKTAFENTTSIRKYHDNGSTIVGKTGMGLASYGENVIVDLHESLSDENRTKITVRSEKEVSVNITANPQRHESAFLDSLNDLRGKDMSEIKEIAEKILENSGGSKEVASSSEFTSAGTKVGIVLILVFIVFIFFNILIFSSI